MLEAEIGQFFLSKTLRKIEKYFLQDKTSCIKQDC